MAVYSGSASAARQRLLLGLASGLALGFVYAGLALLISFVATFSSSGASAASFWPAAGVTIVALLVSPPRRWPWLLAGVGVAEFAVDLHNGVRPGLAAAWGVANVAEPLLSASLLRVTGFGRVDLERRADVFAFIGFAAAAGPALGGFVGAVALGGGLSTVAGQWLRWSIGDGLGVILVAPALLVVFGRRSRLTRRAIRVQAVSLAIALPTMVIPGSMRFVGVDSADLLFLLFPTVVWLSLVGGVAASSFGVALIALVVESCTVAGRGPFAAGHGPFAGLVGAQVFLGATATCGLLVAVVTHDLIRRDALEERLHREATRDSLTGLTNRRGLFEVFADGAPLPSACLMVDLDGFKTINDVYGHKVGDGVLAEVARRLAGVTRPDDLVVRLGGDEFLVCVRDAGSPTVLQALRARAGEAVRQPMLIDGHPLVVEASVGGAVLDGRAATLDELIASADERMYVSKRASERSAGGRSPGVRTRRP